MNPIAQRMAIENGVIKTRGLDLELEAQHRKPGVDWEHLAGDKVECIALIPPKDRKKYLPKGELQNIGEEKNDCASRGPKNLLDTKLTYLYQTKKMTPENRAWAEYVGFIQDGRWVSSARFTAILSGTKPDSGNSMIKPIDTVHNYGLIPNVLFPQVELSSEYYDKKTITPAMKALGLQFRARFIVNYKIVNEKDYPEVVQHDLINVGGFAWTAPVNGIYPNSPFPANHVFLLFDWIKNALKSIFDNYLDRDGDFIKDLAENYNLLDYGYRIYISKEMTNKEREMVVTVFDILSKYGLLAAFIHWWYRYTNQDVLLQAVRNHA